MGAVISVLAGCGSAHSNSAPNPARTRFAVAQYIETRVGAADGATRDGDELVTICLNRSHLTWTCNSTYTPASGLVTSTNQDVADTNAAYTASGSIRLTPAPGLAGMGLNATMSRSMLRKFVADDGSSVGAEMQPSSGMQLTAAELEKQSMATLATLNSLLHTAKARQTSSTSAASAPTSTTSLGATTPPTPSFGASCGTVTSGPDDYNGEPLTVYPGPGVSCGTAMTVMTDLSTREKRATTWAATRPTPTSLLTGGSAPGAA